MDQYNKYFQILRRCAIQLKEMYRITF